jgi:hypothetical protein
MTDMVDLIESYSEETFSREHSEVNSQNGIYVRNEAPLNGKFYRPSDTKWEDDLDRAFVSHNIDLLRGDYNSRAVKLCFACLDSYAVDGSIYCSPCNVKRNRRIGVKTSS